MPIHSKYPAYLGTMHLGYSRLGVTSSRWDVLIDRNAEDLTRRIYALGDPDSTTGIRPGDYSNTETIRGVYVERGGSVPSFASGIVMLQDGYVITLDRLVTKDQILRKGVYVEVGSVEEHYDAKNSFSHRVAHWHRLGLWKEG